MTSAVLVRDVVPACLRGVLRCVVLAWPRVPLLTRTHPTPPTGLATSGAGCVRGAWAKEAQSAGSWDAGTAAGLLPFLLPLPRAPLRWWIQLPNAIR
jgi:hypothetical protein